MHNREDHPKVKALIHSLGLKYNLPDEEIKKIISSPYKFTRETIRHINFKDITEEEFNKTKVNFIFKYLGKMYTRFGVVEKRTRQSEIQKNNLNNRWKK